MAPRSWTSCVRPWKAWHKRIKSFCSFAKQVLYNYRGVSNRIQNVSKQFLNTCLGCVSSWLPRREKCLEYQCCV